MSTPWGGSLRSLRRRGRNIAIPASVLGVIWTAPHVEAVQTPPIQFELNAGSSAGEPVAITVTLINEGPGTLAVDLGFSNIERFTFEVTFPDGTRSKKRPLPPDGFQSAGRFRLEPGEREAVSIDLGRFFSFAKEGPYVISLTYDGAVMRQGSALNVQRQARWEVTLRPRDIGTLRRRCEELLTIIESPTRRKEQAGAVASLVSIRDPVAVPYLLRSAEMRGLGLEEVQALEKIGGPEARDALQRLAKSPNQWMAAAAQGSLGRMKK